MTSEDTASRRVKFYGLADYGTYFQVERAAEILEDYDATRTSYSISEIIELYNTQLFAQNNLFPRRTLKHNVTDSKHSFRRLERQLQSSSTR
jgi:hypothetical protein